MSSTLSGGPANTASTVPSLRLRTQPVSRRIRASSAVQSRYPPRCARAEMTARTAFVVMVGSFAGQQTIDSLQGGGGVQELADTLRVLVAGAILYAGADI